MLGLHETPTWLSYLISFIAMLVAVLIAQSVIVPWQKRKILNMDEEGRDGLASSSTLKIQKNKQIVNGLFDFLQVLSAVFTSFAHGGEF